MRLLGLDLLTLATWPHDLLPGCDAMDDPILEEFAASLAAIWIVMCPPLDHLVSTLAATQLEDGAKAMVTCICTYGRQTLSQLADSELQTPPPQPTQLAADSPPASPQQGQTKVILHADEMDRSPKAVPRC
jgi:hypothetical protein